MIYAGNSRSCPIHVSSSRRQLFPRRGAHQHAESRQIQEMSHPTGRQPRRRQLAVCLRVSRVPQSDRTTLNRLRALQGLCHLALLLLSAVSGREHQGCDERHLVPLHQLAKRQQQRPQLWESRRCRGRLSFRLPHARFRQHLRNERTRRVLLLLHSAKYHVNKLNLYPPISENL